MPLEVFVAKEQSTPRLLPARPDERVEWRRARVHPDSHIACDGRIYPIPSRLIRREVCGRATPRARGRSNVDDERVATHQRGVAVDRLAAFLKKPSTPAKKSANSAAAGAVHQARNR